MRKKFRKHGSILRPEFALNVPVKPNRQISPPKYLHLPVVIPLFDQDQIVYVYEKGLKGEIIEVVNVSYQVLLASGWMTILRFDSEHGFLHGHMRISLNNPEEIYLINFVKKKGDPHLWLTWAINYIKDNFGKYRKGFFKRSGLDKEIW